MLPYFSLRLRLREQKSSKWVDTTYALMMFGTPSDPKNPNKIFFSPVWHTRDRLATSPAKAIRMVKFNNVMTYTKGNVPVYYNLSSRCYQRSRTNTGYVSNTTWIPKFPLSYYQNGEVVNSYIYSINPGVGKGLISPYWFRDFCGNKYTGETAKSGMFRQRTYYADDKYSDGRYKYSDLFSPGHAAVCDGCIIPQAERGFDAGAPYGFVIGLANPKIWPASSVRATFGMIFAVSQANTAHSYAMYYKCGTKDNLFPDQNAWKYTASYPYGNSTSHVKPLCTRFSASDTVLSAVTNDFHHTRMIMKDSSYKYFVVKGEATMTSANTHIFTPPYVIYSGSHTNGIIHPAYIDCWISFKNLK